MQSSRVLQQGQHMVAELLEAETLSVQKQIRLSLAHSPPLNLDKGIKETCQEFQHKPPDSDQSTTWNSIDVALPALCTCPLPSRVSHQLVNYCTAVSTAKWRTSYRISSRRSSSLGYRRRAARRTGRHCPPEPYPTRRRGGTARRSSVLRRRRSSRPAPDSRCRQTAKRRVNRKNPVQL